ncbi:MAG: beta-galactosidase [bacterium]|nr:beta-galactosidase [bacterium]
MRKKSSKIWLFLAITNLFILSLSFAEPQNKSIEFKARSGYTIHFNTLHSVEDAKKSIASAQSAGAKIVNIVPPAHIWVQPNCVEMLDSLFAESKEKNIEIIITRIDANYPEGTNYLYGKVLTPVDKTLPSRVYPTVANPAYEEWLQQETEYYTTHYGAHPNLAGFSIGGFTDLFDSPRASVLVWNAQTKRYELGQYTDSMKKYWQQWLITKFEHIERINEEYHTKFGNLDEIPLPNSESDKRFGLPHRAYFDFVSVINTWWWNQYNYNRKIWQKSSKAPFILQLNGTLIDKLKHGRPGYAAFNLPAWLSNADAIGLSLYTDAELADTGFGSLFGLTNLTQWAKDLGKPIFVLESGIDKPKAGFDLYQLRYISQVAIPLNPKSYIYEHFQYTKKVQTVPSGFIYTADRKQNLPNSVSIQRAYQQTNQILVAHRGEAVSPYLYVITMPKLVRDDPLAAKFYMMLYALSTFVPIRSVDINDIAFIPTKQIVLIAPSWKSELPEIYQSKILQLAKRRSWMVMVDEHTYPQIQRQLGKEIAGATLDLAGYMKEVKPDIAATGLGKAIVSFYLAQKKIAPNGIPAEPGLAYVPLSNGIKIFCDQPVDIILLDSTLWNLNEKDNHEFHITVYRRDTQPTAVQVTLPVIPRGTVKTVRWTVTESAGIKKVPIPAKTIKNTIEFTAKNGVEYIISRAKPITK